MEAIAMLVIVKNSLRIEKIENFQHLLSQPVNQNSDAKGLNRTNPCLINVCKEQLVDWDFTDRSTKSCFY